jgi:hypothetical protein
LRRSALSLAVCTIIFLSFLSLAFLPLAPSVRAESLGTWNSTTSYPVSGGNTGITGSSCAISGDYIYCVGGADYPGNPAPIDSTYYAPISSSGIGSWTATTVYPTNIYLSSCVISGGYITCVGGLTAIGTVGSAVYYAQVTSSGIGSWSSTTAYPTGLEESSCVVSGGYIICVGGLSGIGVNTNAVYYATLSSGVVGTWTSTTVYPTVYTGYPGIAGESCVVSGSYIVCIGGRFDATESNYITNNTYYNTIASGALGTWTSTAAYPLTLGEQGIADSTCSINSGYIYCVGGYGTGTDVNYGAVSSGAVSSWTTTTSYPIAVQTDQCVISGGYIYCVGGETSDAYYSLIGSSTTTSSTTTSTTTSSTSTTNPNAGPPPASVGSNVKILLPNAVPNFSLSGAAGNWIIYFTASASTSSTSWTASAIAQEGYLPSGSWGYLGYYAGTVGAVSGCSPGSSITITVSYLAATNSTSAICPAVGNTLDVDLTLTG